MISVYWHDGEDIVVEYVYGVREVESTYLYLFKTRDDQKPTMLIPHSRVVKIVMNEGSA